MRFFVRKLLPAIVVLLCAHLTADAQAEFKGELVLTPLPGLEGRNMKVLQQFAYIDSKGQLWDVPAGMVTDGASIPRVLWVMFPPWTGNYRKAAVIHDHYCTTKARSWRDTHNVFYEAMLAEGLNERTAKVMWAAVYNFGPRWGKGVTRRPLPASVEEEKKIVSDLQTWVEAANPSREDMAKAIELGRVPRFKN